MWLWLLILMELRLLLVDASLWSSHTASSSKNGASILLVTLPYAGHLKPMAALGEELVRRGHAVTLCTVVANDSEVQTNLVKRAGMSIMIVEKNVLGSDNLAKLENEASNSAAIEALFLSDEISQDGPDPLQRLIISYSKFLDSFNVSIFDIVVIDMYFSPMLACIGKKWNAKMVTLSADLSFNAYLLPPPPAPVFLQGTGSKLSLAMIKRLTTTIFHPVLGVFLHSIQEEDLPCLQCKCGGVLEPYGNNHPHLITSVIGFEFSQPTTPLVEYVGPFLSKNPDPLPVELNHWLNSKSDLSVVYINFGSVNYININQAQNILRGALATNSTVVWSLNQNLLNRINIDPEKVFVSSKWIPNLSLLQHRSIGAAIVHGALDDIQDALSSGVPLILVPFTSDHRDNAARAVSHQLGLLVSASQLSTDHEEITKTIALIKSDPYKIKMAKLQRIYNWAGGVERAAFIIEIFHQFGYDHLVPAYVKYNWSWAEYHNIDVCVVLSAMAILTFYCVSRCCHHLSKVLLYYCSCRRNSSKEKAD